MVSCKKCKIEIEELLSNDFFICSGCNSLIDPEVDLERTEEKTEEKVEINRFASHPQTIADRELKKEKAWTKRKNKISYLKRQKRLEKQKGRKR